MNIDETMLRSRHTHLNHAIVAREMRADLAPTALRFACVLAALGVFVVLTGAI